MTGHVMFDFENVCDKDLGIDSVSSATCIESNESVHQPFS